MCSLTLSLAGCGRRHRLVVKVLCFEGWFQQVWHVHGERLWTSNSNYSRDHLFSWRMLIDIIFAFVDLSSSTRVFRVVRGFHRFLSNVSIVARKDEIRRRKWNRRRIQRFIQSVSIAWRSKRSIARSTDGESSFEQFGRMRCSSLYHSCSGSSTHRFQWQIRSVHRNRTRQNKNRQSRRANTEYNQSYLWKVRSKSMSRSDLSEHRSAECSSWRRWFPQPRI